MKESLLTSKPLSFRLPAAFSLPFRKRATGLSKKENVDDHVVIKGVICSAIPLGSFSDEGLPLNQKRLPRSGPFFQGWLIRMVDPAKSLSCILIVGCFQAKNEKGYSQHYVYSAIDRNGQTTVYERFPDPLEVSVTSTPQSLNKLEINYKVNSLGSMIFNSTHCAAEFSFSSQDKVSLRTSSRVPWCAQRNSFRGPEGWLGRTNLLPCHYYVYSVGSETNYSLQLSNSPPLQGTGFSHIEGNYGSFFPEGWVWSQAIAANNDASMSLVAGKFVIGIVSPMTFIFYLRRRNGECAVFRTIDMDTPRYYLDGIKRFVSIEFRSQIKGLKAVLTIESTDNLTHKVYVPTADGFLNSPGCEESYTAKATVKLMLKDRTTEDYVFPLTALEFGGTFIGKIIAR